MSLSFKWSVALSALLVGVLATETAAWASDGGAKEPAASSSEQPPQAPAFPGIIVGPAQPITPPAARAPNAQPPGCPAQNMKPLELLV